jgi:hypothetical protein
MVRESRDTMAMSKAAPPGCHAYNEFLQELF